MRDTAEVVGLDKVQHSLDNLAAEHLGDEARVFEANNTVDGSEESLNLLDGSNSGNSKLAGPANSLVLANSLILIAVVGSEEDDCVVAHIADKWLDSFEGLLLVAILEEVVLLLGELREDVVHSLQGI